MNDEHCYWLIYRSGYRSGYAQATNDWAHYKQPGTWKELAGLLLYEYSDCLSQWEINFLSSFAHGPRDQPSGKQLGILARLAVSCGLKEPEPLPDLFDN